MTTYEPGIVAVATVRGVPNVRVFRGREWLSPDGFERDSSVTDIRPLVVLDVDYRNETRKDLIRLLRENFFSSTADQIEAQTKPPRIPEPGLWGVVSARLNSSKRATVWTALRTPDGWRVEDGGTFDWTDLIDPVLIREGVES